MATTPGSRGLIAQQKAKPQYGPPAPKLSPGVQGETPASLAAKLGIGAAAATVPADALSMWQGFRITLGVGIPQRVNHARASSAMLRRAVT